VTEGDGLQGEWEAFSAEWIARSEAHADVAREGLLDEWMLDLIGDVSDADVIDLGCGEGRFCRMLAARGARTLGVDLQPVFIDYANSRKGPTETYRLADMQSLDGVANAAFDVAVSYISLVDVPDEHAAIQEAFRVLSPGGRFLVANLSPMSTAWTDGGPWHRDDAGRKLHYVLDGYATEGPRRMTFSSGHQLTNYHRMLSTTVNAFFDAGFELKRIHEPLPTRAQLARVPDNEDLFRVPIFMIYELVKPAL
jgi:SAM-dependent methyltransferase